MRRLSVFLMVVALVWVGCSKSSRKGYEIEKDARGNAFAVGVIGEKDLLQDFSRFKASYDAYSPDSAAVSFLKNFQKPVQIVVVLGTWCPDSQREVGRFLKVWDLAKNTSLSLKMIAVNRSKDAKGGIRKKYAIERVPTFIVYYGNKEIGRIIERPKTTVEGDLVEILQAIH
ncbi:MAG: hypothetical protein GXO76_03830 [Calditrichaeota bacterium]|nr:hypothetical protein [Calditrichota bacterium]